MPLPPLRDLLDVAMEAAWTAGRQTLGWFNTRLEIEWKADLSPVTQADREAERSLRRIIHAAFPDHGILGEEYGEQPGTEPVRWILDPIDGTRSFARGIPLYGVQVGVEVQGEPVVGVIYLPVLDQMLAAHQGGGCTLNGRPCHVSDVSEPSQALLIAHDLHLIEARWEGLPHLASEVQNFRNWGDCYSFFQVITGKAEMVIEPRMSVWDNAPLLTLLEEAGGCFSNWQGKRTIHGGEALASNGRFHPYLLEKLRNSRPLPQA
ncbi:histidinol phosphate phosphatase [bacterium (Candidatus Blackallbacteria) CG17_big_fil_post_rev_8_21_14_2_50_48_46]|uniref:Histidinol phosphate phosphatase n=1 Tax=bacterium (Candidatus Blackallbacteria) CG17_big_fil_post_rev_8_21_14_2_50_48_46 TaxID=2014261 RepID=A0A2M7GBZ8_9BACT|nr:MAG: histidinol phosphate phosphatase [bacterium (Candidatus Blackallbacteria) CG18_big_fil_WC_8_21_14_2_50_49_26]PIW19463.1 MAG: histidinol phosphate phosphatase [bacterium (Candidatus Blackallbacteria) CG17_big_fil_post_rev_8_21_14_2_50_48_46]PIW48933.1 MAG: histidinol phosphate phosphatase [bacterium (Candidatus Blackallbacteria) CG13_big_fil_rev_8_21_14_2_50_49_14]